MISQGSGERIASGYQRLIDEGGKACVELNVLRENPALLSPAVVDITDNNSVSDEEIFGPLLSVIRVSDFDAAIRTAKRIRVWFVGRSD